MPIRTTIIPIFSIIALGWFARRRGMMPDSFIITANRLVYYLAIPALIFRAIARFPIAGFQDASAAAVAAAGLVATGAVGWLISKLFGLRGGRRATFVQCSFHCNLGYIGLAVVFYYLGESELARASMMVGAIMILQNTLAVTVLQSGRPAAQRTQRFREAFFALARNPVILGVISGTAVSATGWSLPPVADRALSILSGLALPMALLIIGASIRLNALRSHARNAGVTSLLKLGLMPGLGWAGARFAGIAPASFLPALLLLGAPTATMTFIMAREMNGDPEAATAAIALSTMVAAISYPLWMALGG